MTRTVWTTIAMVLATAMIAALLPAAAMGQGVQVVTKVVGAPPAQTAPASPDAEGPLSQARQELSAVLKLAAPEGKLVLDRESWKAAEDANDEEGANAPAPAPGALRMRGGLPTTDFGRLVEKLKAKCGSRSGGWSMSNNRMQGTFSGGSLEGTFSSDENFLDLQLREQGVPHAFTLRFHTGESGTGIQLLDDSGDTVVILTQDANGAIRLLHVAGENVTRYQAANYLAMCKDHRDYVEKQLYPLLTQVGVALPMTSYSEPIRAAVLEMLKGKPGNFAELIAQLDSDKYAVRDAATKALSESFLVCSKELKAALENPSSSVETKARIQEVLRQNRPKLEPAAVIESMGLLRDKDLLEEMLKGAKSQADREALTAALEKLKSSPPTRPAK